MYYWFVDIIETTPRDAKKYTKKIRNYGIVKTKNLVGRIKEDPNFLEKKVKIKIKGGYLDRIKAYIAEKENDGGDFTTELIDWYLTLALFSNTHIHTHTHTQVHK